METWLSKIHGALYTHNWKKGLTIADGSGDYCEVWHRGDEVLSLVCEKIGKSHLFMNVGTIYVGIEDEETKLSTILSVIEHGTNGNSDTGH